jgi:hypothetical protein
LQRAHLVGLRSVGTSDREGDRMSCGLRRVDPIAKRCLPQKDGAHSLASDDAASAVPAAGEDGRRLPRDSLAQKTTQTQTQAQAQAQAQAQT